MAIPTDTVYGIACLAADKSAITEIYRIKERDHSKAIAVLIGDSSQITAVTNQLTDCARILAERYWPGALTIVLDKKDTLPEELSPFTTIGVRIPDHEWLRNLLIQTGPLAVSSANISGKMSPSSIIQVLEQLKYKIPLIIDGGECKGGVPSTVVDCVKNEATILRAGAITKDKIFKTIQQSGYYKHK